MEILFLRHGEPAWPDAADDADPPLTERGIAQAEAAAARLAAEAPWDRVVVSPKRRARQTASPLLRRLGLAPEQVDDLAEIDLGDGDGRAGALAAYRRGLAMPPERWTDLWPGGETFAEFHRRVADAIDGVLAALGVRPTDHPRLWGGDGAEHRVVVVAHGGTNSVAAAHLLGLPPSPFEWERFLTPHTGLTRLATRPLAGAWAFALHTHGDAAHLDEITW